MRPQILNYFFVPAEKIKGIGPKIRSALESLLIRKDKTREIILKDLIFHLPYNLVTRIKNPDLKIFSGKTLFEKQHVILELYVDAIDIRKARSRNIYKIICSYQSKFIEIIYFNIDERYIKSQYQKGSKIAVCGVLEKYNDIYQIVHPKYVRPASEIDNIPLTEPVYPLTEGISSKILHKIVLNNLEILPDLDEWINRDFLKNNSWSTFKDSLKKIHNPNSLADITLDSAYRKRLAYDELLANQLAIALTRRKNIKAKGNELICENILVKEFLNLLHFKLTDGQKEILKEVFSEMESPNRMLRLIQGDVGSGKTVIAILAIMKAVEASFQAAFMAPTEILAKQQYDWLQKIISNSDLQNLDLQNQISVTLLTGSTKESERKNILPKIENGEINIVIGTHALFQEKIKFGKLGLIVIDEQHRFGVRQRIALSEKGDKTDILLMSATPIPRTLAMTIYGDMDISTLREKPAGRQEIDTRILSSEKLDYIISGLSRAISDGAQIYWVCPLVYKDEEEFFVNDFSDSGKMISVEERFETLQKIFGKDVGLLHGKQSAAEKNNILQQFVDGKIKILVSTTVIEVGVDVPNATIMIIENAEKFGLAQLHQLRGRVGRGAKKSSCLLVYGKKSSKVAKDRLDVLRQTNDGFKIAEEDLALRGSGDIVGAKQSGFPEYELAELPFHKDLLFTARDDVKMIIEADPELNSERGKALKNLLYLFEYDNHIKLLNG